MKSGISAVIVIVFLSGLLGCSNYEVTTMPSKQTHKPGTENAQNTPPISQKDDILSRDYAVAERALDRAVVEKDSETIRLGLKNPILSIKRKAALAIAETNDVTFVPFVIEALQMNQVEMLGGTETRVLQDELNMTLVTTLAKLTNLKFAVSKKPTASEIQKVIASGQEWWSKRRNY
jgi:hypothetical protein